MLASIVVIFSKQTALLELIHTHFGGLYRMFLVLIHHKTIFVNLTGENFPFCNSLPIMPTALFQVPIMLKDNIIMLA